MTYKDKRDCPPVESFIWDTVAMSYGEFEGIKELSMIDLCQLKALIEIQIMEINSSQ